MKSSRGVVDFAFIVSNLGPQPRKECIGIRFEYQDEDPSLALQMDNEL